MNSLYSKIDAFLAENSSRLSFVSDYDKLKFEENLRSFIESYGYDKYAEGVKDERESWTDRL